MTIGGLDVNQTGRDSQKPVIYDYKKAHVDWKEFVGTPRAVSFINMMHLLETAANQTVPVYDSIFKLMESLANVYGPSTSNKDLDAVLYSHNNVELLQSKITALIIS